MANKRAKAERSKAKDARQSPAPDTEPRHKAKRRKAARPYRLEYRVSEKHLLHKIWPDWATLKRYQTITLALDALEREERKDVACLFNFRIVIDADPRV